jgi:hypothetical protein
MPLTKFFPELDIDQFPELKTIKSQATLFAAGDICHYGFSVVWTKGTKCSLNYLGGNRPPSSIWHPVIDKPIADDDGEISVSLGHFPQGSALTLSFGIQAWEAIPRMAILISNLTNQRVLKIPAADQYKNLAIGEFWQTQPPFLKIETLP